MKLGIIAGYSGQKMGLPLDLIRHAESLGYASVWTSEAWGSDAVTPAAWILANTTRIKVGTAIMQMPARSPAMAAMTAMTLNALSGNRFIVGLGASGPQVVEGWHGVRYGRPVTRLKEYVEIMRKIFAREAALTYDGQEYQIPYRGEGATGLGKPLKSILHCEAPIPIYAATITPAGVEAAAQVADGFFPVWMDPDKYSVFEGPIGRGFAKAGNKTLAHAEPRGAGHPRRRAAVTQARATRSAGWPFIAAAMDQISTGNMHPVRIHSQEQEPAMCCFRSPIPTAAARRRSHRRPIPDERIDPQFVCETTPPETTPPGVTHGISEP